MDSECIFEAPAIDEGQRIMLVKGGSAIKAVPALVVALTAGRSAMLVMSVSLRGSLRSWRKKWPCVMP